MPTLILAFVMDNADPPPESPAAFLGKTYRLARSLPILSIVIISTFVVAALFADIAGQYDPLRTNLPQRLKPPVFAGGTWAHVLGTDDAGRDILSRVIHGARISLSIAFVALVIGAVFGSAVGIISGYLGGKTDAFLMRVADIFISYPVIMLALLLAVVFGPSMLNVVVVVVFVLWSQFARVVRGEVLSIRERDYIALAKVAGAGPIYIMIRHILPNVANTILVLGSLQMGSVIIIEASLSFLGAGVPPPAPAWGSMVALGREFLTTAWWVPAMPSFAIVIVVLSINLVGNWARTRLDPSQ